MATAMVKVLGVCHLPVARSCSAWMLRRKKKVEVVCLTLPDLSRVVIGDCDGVLDQVLEMTKARNFVFTE